MKSCADRIDAIIAREVSRISAAWNQLSPTQTRQTSISWYHQECAVHTLLPFHEYWSDYAHRHVASTLFIMPSKPLDNYLKAHRRKTGLSQAEAMFLIDVQSASTISRHEAGDNDPPLEALLCYELLYGVPLRELFAGRFAEVELLFKERLNGLLYVLERNPVHDVARAHRVRMLKQILGEEPIS